MTEKQSLFPVLNSVINHNLVVYEDEIQHIKSQLNAIKDFFQLGSEKSVISDNYSNDEYMKNLDESRISKCVEIGFYMI